MYTEEQLNDAHEHTLCNKTELLNSEKIGCCSCKSIFTTKEIDIESFPSTADGDEEIRTMICPHCYVDALIGDASGYKITEDFLNEMNEYWFGMEDDDDYDEDDCDEADFDEDYWRKEEEIKEKALKPILSGLGKTIEEVKENLLGVALKLVKFEIYYHACEGCIMLPETEVGAVYAIIDGWCMNIFMSFDEEMSFYRSLWKNIRPELIEYAQSLQDEAQKIASNVSDRGSVLNDLLSGRLF
jgi:hypothetical protein